MHHNPGKKVFWLIALSWLLAGGVLFVAPKILHAPSPSPARIPANEFAPYSKTEAKQRIEAHFGKAFSCDSGDAERLAAIIVTEQAGHDGSGFGYYEFRIHVPESTGHGYVIDGTMDIGGTIHVTRKVAEVQVCPL